MAYRNIFIANTAKLTVKNKQLIVDNGDVLSFPIEDIRSIVFDNYRSTLSCSVLSCLSDNGVCLIVCNEKHMPSCFLLPISSYCRMNRRVSAQFAQSKPKVKRLWQNIVISKINNQAKCLEINGFSEANTVYSISKSVLSGDSTNREGYAARLYFKILFGEAFTRDDNSSINACLNYGYAILRSYISKTLVAYGFEPSVGIHHKNQLNAFNLSDDLIEPFRPVIDNFVFQNYRNLQEEFGTLQKSQLQLLLNSVILINGKRCSVSTAIEIVVQSLCAAFENDNEDLKTPEIIDVDYFDYD